MKNKLTFAQDERTQLLSGRIAVVTLIFTQIGLLGIILYRIYGLRQSNAENGDLRLLLFLTVLGYLALRLYITSAFPVPTLKMAVGTYLLLGILIFALLRIWLGTFEYHKWYNVILPVVLGPAFMVGLYWLFAYLGKKRLEKELDD